MRNAPPRRRLRAAIAGLLALLAPLACTGALADSPTGCPPPTQPPSAEQLRAGARDARDHGFLWRISKGGHHSWLYGTLHVARFEWTFPGPRVSAALNASDTIALEIDLGDAQMQRRLNHSLTTPPPAALPQALRQRLARAAQAECVPPQALATLAPQLQVAALTALAGKRDGLDPAYGIDAVLAGWAHAAGRRVVSLETPEMQLGLLTEGGDGQTLNSVDKTLAELETGRARPTLRRVARIWAEGDWAGLSDYASWCGCADTAADRAELKRLLDDRNPAMAEAIDTLHRSGRQVFAAVGSLHMIGDQGLPALLARRGYRVEPIALEASQETRP
jgi:uncharacterized protein YbaP (TraB family)